jgi:Asp-tRNA(Asn)/Glu-tRNA(Gln) amidotransferase A subunit family amidase
MRQLETDPGLWSALEVAAGVARRQVSPVEVTRAALERIERLDPVLNAFVDVHAEEALLRAEAAERATMRGRASGPLHGVPVAIKDLSDAKRGWRRTRGSRVFSDCLADADSPNVVRLEAAGAIPIGTTNSSELGHKSITDNALIGATSNPFAQGHNAGGSSGGSAAAVAASMVAVATGSDGAGSLRVPASACGVFTLKPTFGRMPGASRPNGFRSAWPMAQSGVLTRTVADAAALMDLLARPHRADPLGSVANEVGCAAGLGGASIAGLRVGWFPDWGGHPVDAEVIDALAPAVRDLERMGAVVDEPTLLGDLDPAELEATIVRAVGLMLADLIETDVEPIDRALLEPTTRRLADSVRDLSALAARRDDRLRTALFDRLQAALECRDVLVGPAVGVAAVPNAPAGETVGPTAIAGRPVDSLLGWSPAYLFNLTGHPAACLPVGETVAGHPVGLQIVADRHADDRLLAVCAAIERDRPWAERYSTL